MVKKNNQKDDTTSDKNIPIRQNIGDSPQNRVVVCPHCKAKVFFNKGTCKWCYGKL